MSNIEFSHVPNRGAAGKRLWANLREALDTYSEALRAWSYGHEDDDVKDKLLRDYEAAMKRLARLIIRTCGWPETKKNVKVAIMIDGVFIDASRLCGNIYYVHIPAWLAKRNVMVVETTEQRAERIRETEEAEAKKAKRRARSEQKAARKPEAKPLASPSRNGRHHRARGT